MSNLKKAEGEIPARRTGIAYEASASDEKANIFKYLEGKRGQAQANVVGRFRGELRLRADTPGTSTLRMNPVTSKHSPDLVSRYIPKSLSQKTSVPGGITHRGRLVQQRKNPSLHDGIVLFRFSRSRPILEPRNALPGKPIAPFANGQDACLFERQSQLCSSLAASKIIRALSTVRWIRTCSTESSVPTCSDPHQQG